MTQRRRTLTALVLSLLSSCTTSGLEEEIRRSDRHMTLLGKVERAHRATILDQHVYHLQYDEQLLLALREFYLRSVTLNTAPSDADQYHVVVKVGQRYGNGYLIDDSGLVLTAFHVVKDITKDEATIIEVIDKSGHQYLGVRTEVGNRADDWALVMTLTGKPPHPHPLPFAENYELLADTVVQFTPHVLNIGRRSVHWDNKEVHGAIRGRYRNEGEDITADRREENSAGFQGVLQGRGMNDLELTALIEPGASGSVVFTSRAGTRKFCGMVWGYRIHTDINEQGGPALLVRSTTIRDGLREFLDAQGMLRPLELQHYSGF